ncbi:MAG TPA: RsmE family RNA methyltransferase [Chitinophagaceae bacterium]|nr:RsmE family RNA methyltransferase [Chitinophagaceae bacterium]
MNLPFFYKEDLAAGLQSVILDEDTSKHMVQVLRMKAGEQLQLTDGKGNLCIATITEEHKKRTAVQIGSHRYTQPPAQKLIIAISLLKNTTRFEWFLEKATEIGVTAIVPLLCTRTEKEHFRYDRMKNIIVSAMLQSEQVWMPELHEPVRFDNLIIRQFGNTNKLIAHCEDDHKQSIHNCRIAELSNCLILIGPTGDFTKEEIALAKQQGFQAVTLGNTRLRTETAGIVAAALLKV